MVRHDDMCAIARMVVSSVPCKIVTEGIPDVPIQGQLTLAFLRAAGLPMHRLNYQVFPQFTRV